MHKRPHITIKQLETLAAVVHYGSLSKATDSLHVSQPALSLSLANLEDQLGIRLFAREKKRLVLTDEGRIIAERASQVLEGLEDIGQLAVDLKSLRRGRISVVAVQPIANGVVSDCVAELLAENDALEIAVRAQSEAMILEWVASRDAELGVTMIEVEHPRIVSKLLIEVDSACAIPVGHPLAAKPVLLPEDLADVRVIQYSNDTQARGRLDRHLKNVAGIAPSTLEVYSATTACELVRRKLGVALVDPFTAAAFVSRNEIEVRPFSISIPFRFHLLQPRHRPESALVRRLVGLMRPKLHQIAKNHGIEARWD